MFENILGQQLVVQRIEEDVENNGLPASLLFFGPPFSGKLSTALELSRVLSCSRGGEWSCGCADCRKHRTLTHPDLVMAGPRYFIQELEGSVEVLRRTQRDFARYLVIRSARKLTRRFDPLLWEGEETKVKGFRSSLDAIEDILDELTPLGTELSQKRVESLINSLLKEAQKPANCPSLNHIPIFMVRNITSWAHTTGQGEGKTIILENAETMLDSARNALLKILEEPPEGVRLILTTPRRGALLPTVISRVRAYSFRERGEEGDREVLERIFREPSGEFRSLREYFSGFDMSPGEIRRHAETVTHIALGQLPRSDLTELYSVLREKRARFIPLTEEIEYLLRDMLFTSESSIDLGLIEDLHRRLSLAGRMFTSYNQNPELLIEGLLYGRRV